MSFHKPSTPAIRSVTCFANSPITVISVNCTPLIITISSCIYSSPDMITCGHITIRTIIKSLKNSPTRHGSFYHYILNHPSMVSNRKRDIHFPCRNWYNIIGMTVVGKKVIIKCKCRIWPIY